MCLNFLWKDMTLAPQADVKVQISVSGLRFLFKGMTSKTKMDGRTPSWLELALVGVWTPLLRLRARASCHKLEFHSLTSPHHTKYCPECSADVWLSSWKAILTIASCSDTQAPPFAWLGYLHWLRHDLYADCYQKVGTFLKNYHGSLCHHR